MTSLTTEGITTRKPHSRRTDRSKRRLDKQTTDPAVSAITTAVIQMMTESWTRGTNITKTIQVPGGHILNRIEVMSCREGDQLHVKVTNVTPCKKLKKRAVRRGNELIAALQRIAVDKHRGVDSHNLEGRIQHNAKVFAVALMRKVHELEHRDPEKDHGRRRNKEKRLVNQNLQELTSDTIPSAQTATSVEATTVGEIATKPRRQLRPSRRKLVQV
jgi:hypothetical protein